MVDLGFSIQHQHLGDSNPSGTGANTKGPRSSYLLHLKVCSVVTSTLAHSLHSPIEWRTIIDEGLLGKATLLKGTTQLVQLIPQHPPPTRPAAPWQNLKMTMPTPIKLASSRSHHHSGQYHYWCEQSSEQMVDK
jgi:hypothetical protein